MDMFVPQNNGENFHPNFPSSDGIQHVRQVYERFVYDHTFYFIHHSF
jgi:hypothetical protein